MNQKSDLSAKTPFDESVGAAPSGSVAEAGPLAEINSAFSIESSGEARHFTLHRILKHRDLDDIWIPQLHSYFPDQTDWEPKTQLHARLFPLMLDEIQKQMAPRGLQYVAFEVEDPSRIHVAYDEEPGGPAARIAAGRVNFYRRETKALIVNDPEIPFVRPASDDDRNFQAYDLMALKILDPECDKFKGRIHYDDEGKPASISKDLYREVYIEMIQQQYGMLPEAELRRTLPAVDQFLTTCDNSPKTTVNLQTGVIAARTLTRFQSNLQWSVPGLGPELQPAPPAPSSLG